MSYQIGESSVVVMGTNEAIKPSSEGIYTIPGDEIIGEITISVADSYSGGIEFMSTDDYMAPKYKDDVNLVFISVEKLDGKVSSIGDGML